jgi:hypothetical protein
MTDIESESENQQVKRERSERDYFEDDNAVKITDKS